MCQPLLFKTRSCTSRGSTVIGYSRFSLCEGRGKKSVFILSRPVTSNHLFFSPPHSHTLPLFLSPLSLSLFSPPSFPLFLLFSFVFCFLKSLRFFVPEFFFFISTTDCRPDEESEKRAQAETLQSRCRSKSAISDDSSSPFATSCLFDVNLLPFRFWLGSLLLSFPAASTSSPTCFASLLGQK